jgi:hypothetical protein
MKCDSTENGKQHCVPRHLEAELDNRLNRNGSNARHGTNSNPVAGSFAAANSPANLTTEGGNGE